MTTVVDRPVPSAKLPTDLGTRVTSGRRVTIDRLVTGSMYVAVVIAVVPLALVMLYVAQKGLGGVSWDMLTEPIPTVRTIGPGIGPAVVGTILVTGLATLIAVPLGILGAVYLNEYGKRSRLAQALRFLANVMAGVPSIVMGLFIYTIWVLTTKNQSAFAGAMALGCLMLPVVIRSTEEMLRLVPPALREGALALGASQSRTIITVVLPAALPGITSGALLAVARAAGETAPLLFTLGFTLENNWNPFSGVNVALPQLIFSNASQPFPGAQERAYVAAFTLIVLVLVFTIAARVVSSRFAKR